jgi:hypothetical protein
MIGVCATHQLAILPLGEIGDNFPTSGPRLNWSDLWAYGIALAVGAALTATVAYLRRRNDMSIHCNNSRKLFRELCMIHGLDHPSQRLLTALAKARRFEQPTQVFLSPEAFETSDLPGDWHSRSGHLRRLKMLLFDGQSSR